MSFTYSSHSIMYPTGGIIFFAGTTAPSGWLFCDGSNYSTTTYPVLYSILGTTYGSGTGTFNVPDLRNQFVRGATATSSSITNINNGNTSVTLSVANMPSHNHTGTTDAGYANVANQSHSHNIPSVNFGSGWNSGAPAKFGKGDVNRHSSSSNDVTVSDSGHTHNFTTNSNGSSTALSIMPPYMSINYIIKY